jgi:hypothetical protein
MHTWGIWEIYTICWLENPQVVRSFGRPWYRWEKIELDLRIKGVKEWTGLKWCMMESSVLFNIIKCSYEILGFMKSVFCTSWVTTKLCWMCALYCGGYVTRKLVTFFLLWQELFVVCHLVSLACLIQCNTFQCRVWFLQLLESNVRISCLTDKCAALHTWLCYW